MGGTPGEGSTIEEVPTANTIRETKWVPLVVILGILLSQTYEQKPLTILLGDSMVTMSLSSPRSPKFLFISVLQDSVPFLGPPNVSLWDLDMTGYTISVHRYI